MKIALLGSVVLPIPPKGQGGTEWIAYYQAKGLSERRHDVLLLAAKGTAVNFKDTRVKVIEVGLGDVVTGSVSERKFDPSLMEASRKLRLETAYLGEAANALIEHSREYDFILNNMRGEAVLLPVARLLGKPFVNVMHLNLFPELAQVFIEFQTHVITISNAQRKEYPDLSYLATVYNGIDVSKFPLNTSPKDYLLMMGTIGRHKNQGAAIRVAKKLGKELVLAGKVRDKDYFEELKKDIDGKQIRWVGELSFGDKIKLYQDAKAFLFPILWEEPFGLVMIEALSCGTPVVAFNRGAVNEVLVDNKTGFVVENEDEMVEAVKKIDTIDRAACHQHVKANFTIEKMLNDYEAACEKITL